MPSNLQAYAQMADHAATQITGSFQDWTDFLTTAARLYKYSSNEQLMIYAQRPNATACAEYDFWNQQWGRYVRRGSKGIAVIDATGDRPKLKYVFDVSDTGTRENSCAVNLWELRPEQRESVTAMLERDYDVSGENGLAEQLERVRHCGKESPCGVGVGGRVDRLKTAYGKQYDFSRMQQAEKDIAAILGEEAPAPVRQSVRRQLREAHNQQEPRQCKPKKHEQER